jgi:hypothetical protein
MSLSKRSLITLLDLVEIKLSCIEVMDREDAKELQALEAAKRELTAIMQHAAQVARRNAEMVPFTNPKAQAAPRAHAHA